MKEAVVLVVLVVASAQPSVLHVSEVPAKLSNGSDDANYRLPDGFIFGAGSLSYQVEGAWDEDAFLETWVIKLNSYEEYFTNVTFRHFMNQVKWWTTLNEPHIFATLVYGYGIFAPGKRSPGRDEYLTVHHMILAHARAYRLYHKQFAEQGGRVGISLESYFARPKTSRYEDIQAAERRNTFELGWVADPLLRGDYPPLMRRTVDAKCAEEGLQESRLPSFTQAEKTLINGTLDFLGLNAYFGLDATDGTPVSAGNPSYDRDSGVLALHPDDPPTGERPACTYSHATPWSIRESLLWLRDRYGDISIMVTENGIGSYTEDGLDDHHRQVYLSGYLRQMLRAIHEDKCNVIGYIAWSLLDSFEWESYEYRFGLVHVDHDSPNKTRTLKTSAQLVQKIMTERFVPEVLSSGAGDRVASSAIVSVFLAVLIKLYQMLSKLSMSEENIEKAFKPRMVMIGYLLSHLMEEKSNFLESELNPTDCIYRQHYGAVSFDFNVDCYTGSAHPMQKSEHLCLQSTWSQHACTLQPGAYLACTFQVGVYLAGMHLQVGVYLATSGDSRPLFFILDPPHLLKTLRNALANSFSHKKSRKLWKNHQYMSWKVIEALYEATKSQKFRSHKLTKAHTFSNSVARCIEDMAHHEAFKLLDTSELVKFIRLSNRFFDCVNGKDDGAEKKNPDKTAFTDPNDARLDFLENEYLGYFEEWKLDVLNRPGIYTDAERSRMIVSHQALGALEITVKGIAGAIRYMLTVAKAPSVSARVFNQDPWEQYFSMIRRKQGDNRNPLLGDFLHTRLNIHAQGHVSLPSKKRKY
ncbi:uncharacterized protein LOC117640435 [Thrips palmi]|uniref:Uncharacterized protein LOC117640435 n=1 Tax=Thrips palmi TaxID=161013 RepID=A0A6P8Y873_THRPL|nr:uncharacterized protein LOC117640435 [Thrips palmi]